MGYFYLVRIFGIEEFERNKIIIELVEMGIVSNVYYKLLFMFIVYKNLGFDIKNYFNVFNMYKNEIMLFLYIRLINEEIKYIIDIFKEILNNR